MPATLEQNSPDGFDHARAYDPTRAKITDRRCITRPRFVDNWRKTISDPSRQPIPLAAREPPSSVFISIARTGSLLRAQSSHRILTDHDWTSFSRLRDPAARRSAIAARILLRLSLSRATGREIAPVAWEFQRTPHGKPRVASNLPAISFSVSHADEIAIVAVSSTLQVGIDVETIDQELNNSLIEDFCHSKEKPALSGLPSNQKTREFLRLWTQKEAYTKLVGLGHSIDFAAIDHSSGQVETFGSLRVSRTHFEGFYIPLDQSLYYTSLAIQSRNASWIELQMFDVIGPDATTDLSLSRSALLSVLAPP